MLIKVSAEEIIDEVPGNVFFTNEQWKAIHYAASSVYNYVLLTEEEFEEISLYL